MERSRVDHPIRCGRCGADRVIPLTVHVTNTEYKVAERHRRPVRAELKCVACGHRTRVHPRLLLVG